MVDEQAEAIYRRTIIHLDHHAVLKNLRDFPQTRQRLGGFHAVAAKRGSRMAHCHHHIDHLLGCYQSPMNSEAIASLLISLFAMLPDDRDGAGQQPGDRQPGDVLAR
jgi:menaquinone-dependent protoporphyrinogen IX oxidase